MTYTFTEEELESKSRKIVVYTMINMMMLGIQKDETDTEKSMKGLFDEVKKMLMESTKK